MESMVFTKTEDEDSAYSRMETCLNQKINKLSAKYKQAIVLTSFQGYSQKDLTEYLKISYSGTKSRVQKARAILKENLLKCPNIEVD